MFLTDIVSLNYYGGPASALVVSGKTLSWLSVYYI